MSTREQERREHEAARAALAEGERQVAYLTGRLEATIEGLRQDPELVAEVERTAKERGAEPGLVMDEVIAKARAKHLPAPSAGPSVAPDTIAPGVRKFRELLK